MAYTKKSIAYLENGVLHFRKRAQNDWILLFVMLWPFLINLVAGLPSPINYLRYLSDGIILYWFVSGTAAITRKSLKMDRDKMAIILWIACFIAYTFLTYMYNYQSAIYYLWGLRMNFRGYILFVYVCIRISCQDADEWLGFLDSLFWLNAVLAVTQFFVAGVSQDHLGGIFGTQAETNGYTLIFLSIVVVSSQLRFHEGREKLWVCLLKCVVALLIAAMAELKFYLLLFVFQMVLVSALTKFSWKKVVILSFCAIAVSISMDLLAQWFSSSGTFNIEAVIEKAFQENYATKNDLNRLSAIGTLTRKILKNPLEALIGLGLGNCDNANFAFLRTPFYERYSYLHYTYFAAPMMFLETGYIGLAFYIGFFVLCLVKAQKMRKAGLEYMYYGNMGVVFSLTAPMLAFYNASLRYEGGWMVYIVLALPFVSTRQGRLKGEAYD